MQVLGLGRLFAVVGLCFFAIQTSYAQFVSENDIPIAIQQDIVAAVIAEYGELNLEALETAYRDWMLSQPVPDADGEMLDSGTCSSCLPPTDNIDPGFPQVRDLRIVTRTNANGRVRHNFTEPNYPRN